MSSPEPSRSAAALFGDAFRRGPLRTVGGLFVEYLTFAAAVFLALLLFATRVPLRLLDHAFGWRLRDSVVDALAKVSPG